MNRQNWDTLDREFNRSIIGSIVALILVIVCNLLFFGVLILLGIYLAKQIFGA